MQKICFSIAAILTMLILIQPVPAQVRRGNYNRRYTKADVERVIARVEERSDRFEEVFDRALDRSRLDGTRREDRLTERAKELEERLDNLRDEFDRRDRYQDTRAQVASVLQTATVINNVMIRRRLDVGTESLWAALRVELNALARFYNLRGLRG